MKPATSRTLPVACACGTAVVWATTGRGRRVRLEAQTTLTGSWRLDAGGIAYQLAGADGAPAFREHACAGSRSRGGRGRRFGC